MALFRRRSRSEGDASVADQVPADGAQDEVLDQAADDARDDATVSYDRAGGPFDLTEADLADTSLTRIDLGSLRIPGLPGLGVQVEADRASNEVVAVTVVGDGAAGPGGTALAGGDAPVTAVAATAGAAGATGCGAIGAAPSEVPPLTGMEILKSSIAE